MTDPVSVLSSGLEQAADMLGRVRPEHVDRSTPCDDWTVGALVDHLVQAPERFAAMMRGEQPDWAAPTPHSLDPEAEFRRHAADLLALWRQRDGESQDQAAWQCAEIAVHTWDLARGLGIDTSAASELDDQVAELGLSFMRANLTDDNRSGAFGPEQPVPDDASPYDRIAAFAGRIVRAGHRPGE